MGKLTTHFINMGNVCLELTDCNQLVTDCLLDRCSEFLVVDGKADFTVSVTCEPGKNNLLHIKNLELITEKEVIIGNMGETAFQINKLKKQGTFKVDSRILPNSLENCLRACFAILLAWRGNILLHAAGILRNGAVYIFFGPSEAGKSTIATLTNGGTALNDESIILSMQEDKPKAQGTPFWGDLQYLNSRSSWFPVAGLFRIHKAQSVHLEEMPPSFVVAEILANIHTAARDVLSVGLAAETAINIVKKVPCYHLYFTKNEFFWRKIDVLN